MPLPRPSRPDALRPTADAVLVAWAERVRADHAQVERLREVPDPPDFHAPTADRFRADPHRTGDPALAVLLELARPDDTWLDIGAGGGRYALPLALATRRVIGIEPSGAMRAVLAAGAADHGIGNLEIRDERWPPAGWADPAALDGAAADVTLLAHVGYDIEDIGPFLDAAEAATARRCVAVMGEGAMTTVASLLWQPIHGEPRVALPALPDLLAVLVARGRLPEVVLVDRVPPSWPTRDELHAAARRQLWLRTGSPKDRRLASLLEVMATERHGTWALDWTATRIGIVSWEPRDPA